VLLAGFLLAVAVTLLFALCIRWLGRAPKHLLDGLRPVSDLINPPHLFSVVVAVAAAIVGVISLTLSKTGALIGVFISITTISAAADIRGVGRVRKLERGHGFRGAAGAQHRPPHPRRCRRIARAETDLAPLDTEDGAVGMSSPVSSRSRIFFGAGEDARGVGVVFAAGDSVVVEPGGPGAGRAGVAGEVADGVAELLDG
jgi:hypothetical protein